MRVLTIDQPRESFITPAPVAALFRSPSAGVLWFVVRLFVGWQWLSAGWHKLYGASSIGWVRDGEVNGRVVHAGDRVLGFWQRALEPPRPGGMPQVGYAWYRDILHYMVEHRWHGWFTYLIAVGEFLVGLALILG